MERVEGDVLRRREQCQVEADRAVGRDLPLVWGVGVDDQPQPRGCFPEGEGAAAALPEGRVERVPGQHEGERAGQSRGRARLGYVPRGGALGGWRWRGQREAQRRALEQSTRPRPLLRQRRLRDTPLDSLLVAYTPPL